MDNGTQPDGAPTLSRRRLIRQLGVVGLVAAAGPLAPAFAAPARPGEVLFERLGGLPAGADRWTSRGVATPIAFSAVGFELPRTGDVEVRTSLDGETWTAWSPVERQADLLDGPDPDSEEDDTRWRSLSTLTWVGAATWIQVRGADPGRVRPHLIDATGLNRSITSRLRDGLSDALRPDEAEAATARPNIITRAQWGANESWRSDSPSYATPRVGIVHHTVNSNSYSRDEAAGLVRSIYHWHTHGHRWSDIGYNFLVDRFGRVYEGRYGGMDRGVVGAHAAGFNSGSIGVAIIGTFTSTSAPSAALDGVAEVLGWRFALHGIDPRATVTMNSRSVRTVSGHRDVGSTACPGDRLYGQLPTLRDRIEVAKGRYSPCQPGGDPTAGPVARIAGADRIATAVVASRWYWRDSTEMVLASGADFADALTGGALAARLRAPLLLTDPTRLPTQVSEEIVRLGVNRVTLLGGTAAISSSVESAVRSHGVTVRRLAGADRFSTAAEVARRVGGASGEAVIALGAHRDASRAWPDAAASGALLSSRSHIAPILLTRGDRLPRATERALADLGVRRVLVIGGTGAIGTEVTSRLQSLGYSVERLAGSNRYDTSLEAFKKARSRLANPTPVIFATADAFPDALTAGPVAAQRGGPVLLLPTCGLDGHRTITDYLSATKGAYSSHVIIGGTSAVSDRVRWQLNQILG